MKFLPIAIIAVGVAAVASWQLAVFPALLFGSLYWVQANEA